MGNRSPRRNVKLPSCRTEIPFVKLSDKSQYAEMLTRSSLSNITMEELEHLQLNLETFLTNCVMRQRILAANRNGRVYRTKMKPQRKLRLIKRKCKTKPGLLELRGLETATVPSQMDDFWSSFDPYFKKITTEDLLFIDDLISGSLRDFCVVKEKEEKSSKRAKTSPLKDFKCLQNRSNKLNSKCSESAECKDISCEIEKCLKELAKISSSNIHNLMKLKARAVQCTHNTPPQKCE